MTLDTQRRVDGETFAGSANPIKHITFDADTTSYQIKPHEQNIRAISGNADGSGILILPSKGEAMGKSYYICAPTGASGGDISVYDKEAGSEIATYGDLDADDDHVIFFCDGYNWRVLLDGVA